MASKKLPSPKPTKHLTLDAGKQRKDQVENILAKSPADVAPYDDFRITKDKRVRKGS